MNVRTVYMMFYLSYSGLNIKVGSTYLAPTTTHSAAQVYHQIMRFKCE